MIINVINRATEPRLSVSYLEPPQITLHICFRSHSFFKGLVSPEPRHCFDKRIIPLRMSVTQYIKSRNSEVSTVASYSIVLGSEADYLDWCFRDFLQSVQANSGALLKIEHHRHLSDPFIIRGHLFLGRFITDVDGKLGLNTKSVHKGIPGFEPGSYVFSSASCCLIPCI